MDPALHEGRRKNRAEVLQIKYKGRDDVAYVDEAEYRDRNDHVAVAVKEDGTPVPCCTLSGVTTVEAEGMAIALAASHPGIKVVISDSKNAIKYYESGRVTAAAPKY